MQYSNVKSRDFQLLPGHILADHFGEKLHGFTDSEFITFDASRVVGATGLPYYMPICLYGLNKSVVEDYLWDNKHTSHLFDYRDGTFVHYTEKGEEAAPAEVIDALLAVFERLDKSSGYIDEEGAHVIDLKLTKVGPHFDVNLLLGNRVGFENPLLTTPKA